MIKKLSAVGNSLGLIIDRPILELLDITKDTLLEVKTDGEALIIRPARSMATVPSENAFLSAMRTKPSGCSVMRRAS